MISDEPDPIEFVVCVCGNVTMSPMLISARIGHLNVVRGLRRLELGPHAIIDGNITIGENCRVGAGSVVLRDVPDNSTVVGVPGHIVFRQGKRVVITDPKQINDPLSEALSAVANEVKELKAQVRELQGREFGPADGDRLQEIIEIDYQI